MVHKVLGNHATFLATFVASFAETVGRVLTQAQNTTMTAARIATGAVP